MPPPHSTCRRHAPAGYSKTPSPQTLTTASRDHEHTCRDKRSKVNPSSLHYPSPVSGVDPAGALVNVVDVVDFAIKVSGFLPAFRKWQLGAGHVSRVSAYRTPVCAESYRREARLSHHHRRHQQQQAQHQVPKHPPLGLGHRPLNDNINPQ